MGRPQHDKYSHGADAFRMLAVRSKPPGEETPRYERALFESKVEPGHGWMV